MYGVALPMSFSVISSICSYLASEKQYGQPMARPKTYFDHFCFVWANSDHRIVNTNDFLQTDYGI